MSDVTVSLALYNELQNTNNQEQMHYLTYRPLIIINYY